MLLAGASTVAALGPVLWFTAEPAAAFAQKVEMKNGAPARDGSDTYYFNPFTASIKPGDKIIWLNSSNHKHTVTSDGGGTAFDYTIAPGREEELRFDTPGTYTYHCTIHTNMKGTIQVGDTPPTTAAPAPPPPTTAPAPPTTTTTAPATTTTAEPTTTTTEPRPAFGIVPVPPVPSSSAAPPPVASSTTTSSAPATTTTTAAPPTTDTSAAPAPAAVPPPPTTAGSAPPATGGGQGNGDKLETAAGRPAAHTGELDAAAVALVAALVAVGAFGGWTLIRIRPGRI